MSSLHDKVTCSFKKDYVRTILFYIAAAFLMHLDRFVLGSNAIIRTHDHFNAYWPFQKALAERIMKFQLPGWLPDYTGGLPFFMWDINWLFFPMIVGGVFPEPWKITAITMMQFFLAGFGAYLFLHHFFDTDETVSLLGGLLWGISTFNMSYWRIFDLAALPMLFFCVDRITLARGVRERAWLLLGLLVCAGNIWFIKGAPFIAIFQFFFILFVHKSWKWRIRVFTACSLFWIFLVLLNLPMIVSLLANALDSNRKLIEWVPRNTSLRDLLDNIVSYFIFPIHSSAVNLGFVASLAVFFPLLFQFRKWPRLTKLIFFYFASVLFLAQFVIYSPWFLAFWQTLPISGFRLQKIILVGPFVFFILAMSNFQRFVDFLRGSMKRVFLLIIVMAAVFCFYHFSRNVFPSNYAEVLVVLMSAAMTMLVLAVLKRKGAGKRTYILLFMALIVSERFVYINLSRPLDYHPPSFTHFYSSDLFDRFRPVHKYDYRIGGINWHPAVGLYNGHQVAGGYNAAYLIRYVHFWDAVVTGEEESKVFLSYFHKAYLLDEKVKRDAYPPHVIRELTFSTDLLALHNVRYIFSFNEIATPGKWGLALAHEGIPTDRQPGFRRGLQVLKRVVTPIPYYVYEVKHCLPRVFLSDAYRLVAGKGELKESLRSGTAQSLRNEVVYDKEDLLPETMKLLSKLQEGVLSEKTAPDSEMPSPQITYYSDNKIVINVASPSLCQVVLNENYFRDWTATVNGRPAPILPAYGVFRSVILEKGASEVVFEFRPLYLVASLWVSGLGSIFFLAVCFWWACAGTTKEKMKSVE